MFFPKYTHFLHPFLIALVVNILFTDELQAKASGNDSQICDYYAKMAAQDSNVPLRIMLSITRVETGRKHQGVYGPWPWTINVAGDGQWFDTSDAAQSFAFSKFKQGVQNFDVGCFQLNFRWHGHAFASIEDMFDPFNNAKYAAQFLVSLYRELGSWRAAVAAYHSRNHTAASKYMQKYDRVYAQLQDVPVIQEIAPEPTQSPAQSLYRNAQIDSSLGSLVPIANNTDRAQNATIRFGALNE